MDIKENKMEFIWGAIFGGMGIWIVANFVAGKVARRHKLEIKFYKEEITKLNEWIIAKELKKPR